MKFTKRVAAAGVVALAASMMMTACSSDPVATTTSPTETAKDLISVGFVAVGPEGAWRQANEANVEDTFTKAAGYDLTYSPAVDLDQQSQIDSFNSFVDQGVDVILLSATEASGWEGPLKRAQQAGIPVVLVDRGIEPDDPSLYVSRIAPDNFKVAQSVGEWAVAEADAAAQPLNYYVLEGPDGVGVVNERNEGWDDVTAGNEKLVRVGAQTANWSSDEARTKFAQVLKDNNNDIQLVFAQNDEMGLGAALAVEDAGLKPGVDIKIATIDGTKGAMEALAAGRLSFVAEYNPLFGDTLVAVVKAALAGDKLEPYIIVPSDTFGSPEAAQSALPDRKY